MTPVAGIAIGVLLAILGVPLILRQVPRTRFYGLRVPPMFRTDALWHEANRRSGWDMVHAGAAIVLLSVCVSQSTAAFGVYGRDFLTASIIIALVVTGIKACVVAGRLAGMDERDG